MGIRIITLFFLFGMMCSCATLETYNHNRKVRKAKRKVTKLENKYPDIIEANNNPIVYTGAIHDTIIQLDTISDTIRIETERIIQKFFYNKDKIYTQVECKPDTIYKTKVQVIGEEKPIKKLNWWDWQTKLLIFGLGVIFLVYKRKEGI